MSIPLQAFKAACLISPHDLQKIKLECASLTSLLVFPFITLSNLAELKEQFPKYVALTEEVSSSKNGFPASTIVTSSTLRLFFVDWSIKIFK